MMQATEDVASLPETVAILRRRWLIIVAFLVITPIITTGYAIIRAKDVEPRYGATTVLASNPNRAANLDQLAILANSGTVGDDWPDDGGPTDLEVRATTDPATNTLRVTATSLEPAVAVETAQLATEALLDRLAADDAADYERQLQRAREQLQTAEDDLAAVELAAGFSPDDPRLQSERTLAVSAYTSALDALQSIQSIGPLEAAVDVLSPATEAEEIPLGGYSGLPRYQHVGLGLVIGGLLGIGAAFAREALDRRLTTAQLVSEAFGMPVLTEVPDGGKAFADADQLAPVGSTITEAYRRLRTVLQLESSASGADGRGMVVLVVSAAPREGKTTAVAHLARALGEVGHKVLAVSADFRRPRLHRLFGVEPTEGLAIDGDEHIAAEDLLRTTDVKNVHLVTAGRGTDDPTQLLDRTNRLITVAREHFDFIVIDSSPLLSANDALDLLRVTDKLVVVARFGETNRLAAEKVRDILMQTGAPTLGVVVNAVKGGEGYGYYYGGYLPSTAPKGRTQPSDTLS